MSEFWKDPFQAARARARRPWGTSGHPDKRAPDDRVFPEHVLGAALTWVHRLRLERKGERRLRRPTKTIRRCANRWPREAERLRGSQATHGERRDAVRNHGADAEEGRRLWIASALSGLAVFAFLAIEFGFARSALDLFLADPDQLFLGYKIVDIGAVAIALTMAAAAEIAARSIRGFLDALPSRFRRLLVILGSLLLPVAFVLPFLALRTEAAELEGQGVASAVLPGIELGEQAANAGTGEQTIPFLILGLAPVLVGAVLRAATSSPHADQGLRLRLGGWRSGLLRRAREWRFARLVGKLDAAELRLARRVRAIARREAADEAGRIVDRIGYRLVGERWYGWLEKMPAVVQAAVLEQPGQLPGGGQLQVRERFEVTRDHLVDGGPVRQELEARFGNPLNPPASPPRIDLKVISRSSSNNHHDSRTPAGAE